MTNTVFVDTSEIVVTAVENKISVNVNESVANVIVGTSGPQGPRGSQILSGVSDPSEVIGLIGDQYINTSNGILFGPKTENGWGQGYLLGSGLVINDVAYTHIQTIASNIWNIFQQNHNLGFIPNVTVVDLEGNVIEGDCQYDTGNITVIFSEPIAGLAYLS